jgi:hypothetical protein
MNINTVHFTVYTGDVLEVAYYYNTKKTVKVFFAVLICSLAYTTILGDGKSGAKNGHFEHCFRHPFYQDLNLLA